jgi:uncharacterized protein YqhQ
MEALKKKILAEGEVYEGNILGVAAVRRAGGEYAYNEQDTEKNCKYFFCHFHSRFLRKKYLLSERTLK